MGQLGLGLVGFLIVSWQVLVSDALPCSKSGYCSKGQTQPYVGDISTGDGLRAALRARSYKRELIIMVTTSHRMLPTLQAISNLRRLGLEHILMISTDAEECENIAKRVPEIGCTWDSFQLPMIGEDIAVVVPVAPLWHIRWRTIARAIRLRYNILCMDSDVIIFDDPYKYLKAPPFRDFTVLDQPEVLYHETEYKDNTFTNGGIVYVQNAAPAGPAAWLIAEVSDRLLRWVEDDFKLLKSRGMQTWCCYLDQDCFTDSLSSVMMGRPFWHWAINVCTHEWYKEKEGTKWPLIRDTIDGLVANKWNYTQLRLPTWMHPVAGGNATYVKWIDMILPTSEGVWPEEMGGNLYPPQRGNLSLGFLEQLRTDTSEPLWPDPEDPSPEAIRRARATPTEKFGFFPPWFVLNYFARGRLGYWNTGLLPPGSPPQQVVGHAHYIPDTHASIGKNVMKMLTGHYDWTMAHSELGGEGVFFANQANGDLEELLDRKEVATTIPRLVALHPRIKLGRTRCWEEYQQVLIGLVQVAAITGRTVLFPDPPCATPWIAESTGGRGNTTDFPLQLRMEWMPWGPSAEELRCIWGYQLSEQCMFELRGMVSVEFAHYKQRYGLMYPLEPTRSSTAFIPALGAFKGMNMTRQTPASQILVLSEEEVMAHMEAYKHEQVVYLAHPVQVALTESSQQWGSYSKRYRSCKVLSRWVVGDLAKNDPPKVNVTPIIEKYEGGIRNGRLVRSGHKSSYEVEDLMVGRHERRSRRSRSLLQSQEHGSHLWPAGRQSEL